MRQPQPGRFVWTTPAGKTYLREPEPIGPIIDTDHDDTVNPTDQPAAADTGPPAEPNDAPDADPTDAIEPPSVEDTDLAGPAGSDDTDPP